MCFLLFSCFRVYPLPSDVFQYILYVMFTGVSNMASALSTKIFQGKETHRIINTQAASEKIIPVLVTGKDASGRVNYNSNMTLTFFPLSV